VRQADAHSWVEVFDPGVGWITFDPTPASEVLVPATGGVWGTVQEWYDSLKLQWYKWVVEYDLEKQWAFYTGVLERMGSLRDALPKVKGNVRSRKAWKEGFSEWVRRPATWLMFASPFILMILWRFGVLRFIWSLLLRLRPEREVPPDGAMEALYLKMLKRLTRQGVGRRPQETPRELASRLKRSGHDSASTVHRLTRGFEEARYAGREPSEQALSEMERELDQVGS
ncbi:MAG: DUF4129 domain-containing protein, partial [Myxococcota bacterium]|nr:DUF4129 domain-containing protein [Myxococcota bacterium]